MARDGHDAAATAAGAAEEVPQSVRNLLTKARTAWLKNTEVLDLLSNYQRYNFTLNKTTPNLPPGGTLFLFNRKATRFFRRDGHNWRKKADGKTIRETHEKLKVDNREVLNCYYAHADQADQLQRRCYWMLDGDDSIVLVHYLAGNSAARLHAAKARAAASMSHDRGPGSPPGSGLAQQAQARAQQMQAGGHAAGLDALCSAMGSTAAARSLVDDINAALSAVSGGRMPQETHALPDGLTEPLGSFTFGSSGLRQGEDGSHHFTITTGNTTAGPGLRPMSAEVDTSASVIRQASCGDGVLAKAGSEQLPRQGSAQRLDCNGGADAATGGTVPLVRLRIKGGPTLEPNATLNEDLARTESLSSQPDGAPRSDLDDVGPAESHVARRAPSLQRSSYVSGSGQGRDRGLLMLHEAHQVAAAAAEPARQQPLPNGMALPTSAADTIRAVLDHQQQQRQQQQTQTTDMPPPGAKVNGLELALQRAWVDAAARRAKRDSLGKLAEDVLSSVLHATAPPAGSGCASGSAAPLSPGVARPVPWLLERAPRDPDFDDLRGKSADVATGGASTSAAGKRDAAWMDQLQRNEQLAASPLGMGLMAGLPAKGDSAFAKAARAPVRLGSCQPQLPSAGVSAFASYPAPSKRQRTQGPSRIASVPSMPPAPDTDKERSTDSGDSMGDSCEPSIACLPPRLSRGLRR